MSRIFNRSLVLSPVTPTFELNYYLGYVDEIVTLSEQQQLYYIADTEGSLEGGNYYRTITTFVGKDVGVPPMEGVWVIYPVSIESQEDFIKAFGYINKHPIFNGTMAVAGVDDVRVFVNGIYFKSTLNTEVFDSLLKAGYQSGN